MFKKTQRIPRGEKITPFHSFSTPYFVLKSLNNNLLYNRYRFVISKKTEKKAVLRNKIKRVFFDCVKSNNTQTKGKDMIFIINKKAISLEKEALCKVLKETTEKVK